MQRKSEVLIVDDEKNVGLALMRSLKHKEFEMHYCESAQDALALLDANMDIDLVLTDYSMPAMNGLELLTEIRDRYPNIKRFMLSAFEDFTDVVQGLNDGRIDKFFKKPWNDAFLRDNILEALREKRMQENEGLRPNLETMEILENLQHLKFIEQLDLQIENTSTHQSIALVIIGIENMRDIYIQHGIKKFQEVRSLLFQETLKVIKNKYYVTAIDDSTFGLLIPFQGNYEALKHQIESMLNFLVKPYILHHGTIEPMLKVGVSIYPDHGVSGDFLLRNAQEALFDCRNENTLHFYQSHKEND